MLIVGAFALILRALLTGDTIGLCASLMGGSESMVDPANALPGRQTEMRVSATHYMLKTPMKGPWPDGFKVAVFANGCFWGSEKGIWRLPGGGIHSTAVGYAAGFTPNPTYEEACSGLSGHTEAVQVVYDPSKISFVDILRWFWEAHDPTCGMGQGNDRGTQYRSGFYWFDEEQRQLIQASAAAYEAALAKAGKARKITTEMKAAADFPDGIFYFGEDYHQQVPPAQGARLASPCLPPTLWNSFSAPRIVRSTSPSRGRGRTARHSRRSSRSRHLSSGRPPASRRTLPSSLRPSGRSMDQSRTASSDRPTSRSLGVTGEPTGDAVSVSECLRPPRCAAARGESSERALRLHVLWISGRGLRASCVDAPQRNLNLAPSPRHA